MRRIWISASLLVLLTGGAAAQPPVPCDEEVRSVRWLARRYFEERTQLELALAASESRRQAAEARLKALEEALKSAPKGQNPVPK